VQQRRPGAVDEEHPKAGVALVRDPAQATNVATGGLAGCEPEGAGQMAGRGEALDVPEARRQGGGGEQAHAGDGAKPRDERALAGQRVELVSRTRASSSQISSAASSSAGRSESGSPLSASETSACTCGTTWRAPTGIEMPSSHSRPRKAFRRAVRVAIQADRSRCRLAMTCCSTDLTGTGRIASLRGASRIGLVSLRSVFLRST